MTPYFTDSYLPDISSTEKVFEKGENKIDTPFTHF